MFKELKGVLGAATVFGLAASGTACTTVSPHTVEANNPQEFFYAGQTANSYILLYLEKNPPGSPGYEAINLPKNTSLYYTVDGEIYVGDKNGVPAIGGFAKNYDGYRYNGDLIRDFARDKGREVTSVMRYGQVTPIAVRALLEGQTISAHKGYDFSIHIEYFPDGLRSDDQLFGYRFGEETKSTIYSERCYYSYNSIGEDFPKKFCNNSARAVRYLVSNYDSQTAKPYTPQGYANDFYTMDIKAQVRPLKAPTVAKPATPPSP
ncbi:MAG: hypothetical protein CMH30_03515 [Micavibrio sp.]|nr:hypothetical protein [Micavibrio sp.]